MLVDTDKLIRLSNTELKNLSELIKTERRNRFDKEQFEAAGKWRIGDWVEFDTKNFPYTIKGQIKRINLKSVSLHNCSDKGPGWNVSASLIRKSKGHNE